jgi:O-antigen/teichoic acid export membrane protein
MASERVHKSILNAEVNLIFYFLALFLSFFSRKIFLECLGAEFIGLTGTLGNILGYLNLAELGIGSCISIYLYKPLKFNNHAEISEIISVIGYLYRIIGYIILGIGIIISLFFPIIFSDESFGMGIIYFSFFSFLCSSLIGYFINYRQILLVADQKNYIVSAYFQTASLIKTGLQIFIATYYKNLYLWVIVEFIFGVISCIILNWKINKEYPWLKSNKNQGKQFLKNYPQILTSTRQIFIHQIKDFILNKSDELLIFIFVSLESVAFYGNYTIIVTKVTQLFTRAQDGIGASVGNLIAEGNKERIINVFWELMSMKYFIAGFISFAIYFFTEPFIVVWLGEEYLLSHIIITLLTVFCYLANTRGVVDMYNHAYGLYADTWAAWAELVINLTITIVCGLQWGIIGILLGKIISVSIIIVLWKPYYLFNSGIHLSVWFYWKGTIKYHLMVLTAFIGGFLTLHFLPFNPSADWISWILYCTIGSIAFLLLEIGGFRLFTPGTTELTKRFFKKS